LKTEKENQTLKQNPLVFTPELPTDDPSILCRSNPQKRTDKYKNVINVLENDDYIKIIIW